MNDETSCLNPIYAINIYLYTYIYIYNGLQTQYTYRTLVKCDSDCNIYQYLYDGQSAWIWLEMWNLMRLLWTCTGPIYELSDLSVDVYYVSWYSSLKYISSMKGSYLNADYAHMCICICIYMYRPHVSTYRSCI